MADASKDVFGIKPLGEAVHVLTKTAVEGAASFLGRICGPAADEFGLLLRDRVSQWRANNALTIAQKAERKYKERLGAKEFHAHPRLVSAAVENGSWSDVPDVQDMWAGLLVSACTVSGTDEDNLMFVNLLSQLNTTEAKLLLHTCTTATKRIVLGGLISADALYCTTRDLRTITGIVDVNRIDRELDHLRTLGLIQVGFNSSSQSEVPLDETVADIAPTPLGLNMFVRCQGTRASPLEFFGLIE